MRTVPCSVCGDPRPVSAKSRPTVTCQPCRRRANTSVEGIERQRALNRGYSATYRAKHRPKSFKSHRARARHFGVAYELIIPRRVYIRDDWRCGICGKAVDPQLSWPDTQCASLDHIVPMSLGGGHLYVNVQCAHWMCNTLKSNRGAGDQLALMG